jgi:hypothetical protein
MGSITRIAGLAAFAFGAVAPAGAQTCLGRPYFSTGHIQLGAVGQIGGHMQTIGGELGFGRDRSVFGIVNVGHQSVDAVFEDPSGITFGGMLGYQISAGSKMQFCPVVSGDRASLDFGDDATLKRSTVMVGGSLGFVLPSNSGFHVVPYAGLGVAQLSQDFENVVGGDATLGTDTYAPVTLGIGLHFERAVMIIPQLTIPVDLGSTDPWLTVRVVFPFGGRN